MKNVRTLTLLLLVAAGVGSARGEWHFDAETGAVYDSNLSNSDRVADVKDDWAWQGDFRAGNGLQLARDLRLNLAADLREEVWARFDAFDSLAPGGNVGLRYRFGLGRQAPWVLLEDSLSYAFLREDERSGLDNRFRLRGGLVINQWFSAEAAYTFDDFEAKDPFWDLSGHSGSIRLIFDPGSSLQLALGYSYRNGEVISYALPPRADIAQFASELDSVNSFGSPAYTAYRLHGSTNAVSASAGYTLNRYIAILLTYEFSNTSSGPLNYEKHLVEAKVAFTY